MALPADPGAIDATKSNKKSNASSEAEPRAGRANAGTTKKGSEASQKAVKFADPTTQKPSKTGKKRYEEPKSSSLLCANRCRPASTPPKGPPAKKSRPDVAKQPNRQNIGTLPPNDEDDDASEVDDTPTDSLGNSSSSTFTVKTPGTPPPEIIEVLDLNDTANESVIGTESFAVIAAFGGATKLTESDKESLAAEPSIFVGLPTAFKGKENFLRLASKVKQVLRGHPLKKMVPSGSSYIVAVMSSAEDVPAARRALENGRLNDDDPESSFNVDLYGRDPVATVWQVVVPSTTKPKFVRAIKNAIAALPEPRPAMPPLAVRRLEIDGVTCGRFFLRFEGKMRWLGKQLQVGEVKRLVKQEGRRCLFCSKEGHSCWDCTGLPAGTVLKDVMLRRDKSSFEDIEVDDSMADIGQNQNESSDT